MILNRKKNVNGILTNDELMQSYADVGVHVIGRKARPKDTRDYETEYRDMLIFIVFLEVLTMAHIFSYGW